MFSQLTAHLFAAKALLASAQYTVAPMDYRYADDGLVHCKNEGQAKHILDKLRLRFQECGLELHPQKTKIIYCKDGQRKGQYENTTFDFLGYTFK